MTQENEMLDIPGSEVIKKIMLNSTEHKFQLLIKNAKNDEFSCFQTLRCFIYHAYNC